MAKWVYSFGARHTEGSRDKRDLLGGKGANLAEMAALDLPVPPGFTITTEVCSYFYNSGKSYPADLEKQVKKALDAVEVELDAVFGDTEKPLLLSVRSGAKVSMPGMMDTLLNLGLNDETVRALAENTENERFAYDSYRRFIQMYGDVVMGIEHYLFEDVIDSYKRREGLKRDTDVTAAGWREIIVQFKKLVKQEAGEDFPQNVKKQLWGAIGAVFESWNTPRAKTYRRIHGYPDSWGTAVTVQAMVFGNIGDDCATGVAFTRNPSTGENEFYGEFLVNAQGEDVVAGIRTPQPLTHKMKREEGGDLPSMEETLPVAFEQLENVCRILERHYKDMQDIEFTVQSGQLYMLQTRTGKRSGAAALRIATEMVEEKLITQEEALLRIDATSLDQLLHPTLDPKVRREVLAKGLPASPGAASGRIVFSADEAEARLQAKDMSVILVRPETSPEDIHGMHAAKGILTSRGGMTSHAAVVARGMGRPCVAGATTIDIDLKAKTLTMSGEVFQEGDVITIDGTSGEVMKGQIPTISPELTGEFEQVMGWADAYRSMKIRSNADTMEDCKTARNFGAEGIGLCRTEHMFFDPDRIQRVREMILAEDTLQRQKALDSMRMMQRDDFFYIFREMDGLPVTVRLLDPPLHEFLPHDAEEMTRFAKAAGMDLDDVKRRVGDLTETNPMLGHRGCRLGITYPEIYKMQAWAIFEAAMDVKSKGKTVLLEIMVPLVATRRELGLIKKQIEDVAAEVFTERQDTIEYKIGTMIELPRAALCADQIAQEADFFSFGTNDLTQTALGISRDDAGRFLPIYSAHGIYERDPFIALDKAGVGQLLEIAVQKGRAEKPDLKLGVCGEHGGDPASILFFQELGLDYVSCSPFRVPIARLAAAQAALTLKAQSSGKSKTKKAA